MSTPTPETVARIREAVGAMGPGPLAEDSLRAHVWPLFSRVLANDTGTIYLANHSLGRPLDATADDVREGIDQWYARMDGAWEPWMDEQRAFRGRVASMIGCGPGDAVVWKTSAGQGLRAVLNALPTETPRVVATAGEFDSVDFILRTYQQRGRASVRWAQPDAEGLFRSHDIADAIDATTDLVVVPMVFFVTGQVLGGLDEIIRRAHECDAVVLLDAYHAAGVLPIAFGSLGADFMISGSYKYARGGPGACWLAIHERHLAADDRDVPPDGIATLDTGWFAKADTFAFERLETPRLSAGADAWAESTPGVLEPYQARAGMELLLALGIDRLREYNRSQQAFLAERLRAAGARVREIEPRGAYLLIPVEDRHIAINKLAEVGINTDARACPATGAAYVRLCPDILNPRDELADAAERIGRTL